MVTFGRMIESTRGWFLKNGEAAEDGDGRPREASTISMVASASSEEACIEACRASQEASLELLTHCIRLQGYYSELGHLRLLEDCARICETTVDFLLRRSEIRTAMLALCADVCERCCRDCERFDYDQRLLAGATAFRRCADHCRRVVLDH
jgi:hypothetical protein